MLISSHFSSAGTRHSRRDGKHSGNAENCAFWCSVIRMIYLLDSMSRCFSMYSRIFSNYVFPCLWLELREEVPLLANLCNSASIQTRLLGKVLTKTLLENKG